VNSNKNHSNEIKMCGVKKVVINEPNNLKQQQQQQIDLNLSIEQYHKHNQNNKDNK